MGGCLARDKLAWGVDHVLRCNAAPARSGARRRALARDVAGAAGQGCRCSSPTGWATSAATPSGSTARSARTTARSSARSMPSAAGPTATPTRSRACWQDLNVPAQGADRPLGAHLSAFRPCPGPAIGFLQECLRWWDHWLKGIDTGIMDEPMLRAWIQEPRPAAGLLHRGARAAGWPSRAGRPATSARGARV